MTPLSGELLHRSFDCYEGTRIEKTQDGWNVISPAGRTIPFTDKGIDFNQFLTPLMPGETKENREEMLFETCYLSQDMFGCIDVRRMKFIPRGRIAAYAKGYGFTVDENTFRSFGIADAKADYGEKAMVENNWFPAGWRITVPDVGYIVIGMSGKELSVRRSEGDLYEKTLRFMEKMQGRAVVRGKTNFCAEWIAHGETLGVRVIPEIPRRFWSVYLLSHICWLIGAVAMLPVLAMFPNIAFRKLALGAWGVAALAMGFMWGNDRRRGEVLLNKFPQMGSRKASLDAAKARGMLL